MATRRHARPSTGELRCCLVAHPEVWGLWPSIFVIAYAIIGGVGSVFGPLVGAAVGVLVVELLRVTEGLQGVLLGVALIVFGLLTSGGLTGAFSRDTIGRIVGRCRDGLWRSRAARRDRSAPGLGEAPSEDEV